MPTPFPLPTRIFSGAEGEGVFFLGTNPVGVGHGSELATSSLEGLDNFYIFISLEPGLWIGSAFT